MTVHYENAKGEEKFIKNVLHLQNIDNDTWAALLADGQTELTLLTTRIEAIIDDKIIGA